MVADAPTLHLLEEAAAAHVAHEEDHLYRLDVGAGRDHVHGHGYARVVAVAERETSRSSGATPVVL